MPPHSLIDLRQYSAAKLAQLLRALNKDPVAYMQYHAWRRCGVFGNYTGARALSLDTLPCRLCERISVMGGRNHMP
eukprot:jgi/Mesen1/9093/ME000058S08595